MDRKEYLSRAREFAARGNALPHAKMDPEKVRRIRHNHEGKTARQWADEFGCHYRTIEKIRHYETWVHV